MKQGVGRGAPASLPALPAPPVWQGDTLQAAATCGHGDGNPGFGDGRQWVLAAGAGSGRGVVPASGSLPSRHVPGRGPGLRDSDASGHKPKAGESAPLNRAAWAALPHAACRGRRPQTLLRCPQAGAGRGACARCTPSPPCTPWRRVPPRLAVLPMHPLPALSVYPFPAAGWAGAGAGGWLHCPASLSLPLCLSPALVPLPAPSFGGSRCVGCRPPRDDGVQDAAVLSGPKPGCARQG